MLTRPALTEASFSDWSFGLTSTSSEEDNQPIADLAENDQLPEDLSSSGDEGTVEVCSPCCELHFSSCSEQPADKSAQDGDSDFSFGLSSSGRSAEIPDDQPAENNEHHQHQDMDGIGSSNLLDIAKADYHFDQIIRKKLTPSKLRRQTQVRTQMYACVYIHGVRGWIRKI